MIGFLKEKKGGGSRVIHPPIITITAKAAQ